MKVTGDKRDIKGWARQGNGRSSPKLACLSKMRDVGSGRMKMEARGAPLGRQSNLLTERFGSRRPSPKSPNDAFDSGRLADEIVPSNNWMYHVDPWSSRTASR